MSQTISYRVEDAVAGLLNSVTGLNVYKSNRVGARLFPYATIKADVNDQMLGNYTGVYDLNIEVNYSDTAAKVSQEAFDGEYCNIFESFYSDTPSLVNKLNAQTSTINVYMARIISQTPTIRTAKRAWQRGLVLNIYATPLEGAAYLASLDFSDHRNSMYLALI